METKKIKEGQIISIDVFRSGNKDGREWTMYKVDISGEQFMTFDGAYKTKVNQVGKWEYTEKTNEKDGKTYVNKTLSPLPRPKSATEDDLKKLEARVAKLEMILSKEKGNLYEPTGGDLPEINISDEDIDPNDLPF